jgi:hypothetical protein
MKTLPAMAETDISVLNGRVIISQLPRGSYTRITVEIPYEMWATICEIVTHENSIIPVSKTEEES